MAVRKLKKLFLQPSGWLRARSAQRPVTVEGKPLPWFTYGAIEFLENVARADDRVFEFGAGYSTLWWQERVSVIHSVEHDQTWCAKLRPLLADNVYLEEVVARAPVPAMFEHILEPFFAQNRRTVWPYSPEKVIRRGLDDESFQSYAATILQHDGTFDFIVVDGMARRLCTYTAITKLSQNGFIILDNSNRSDYDLAYALLEEAGFCAIPFWGLVPGADFISCTSFFVRDLNRLPSATFHANSLGLPEY